MLLMACKRPISTNNNNYILLFQYFVDYKLASDYTSSDAAVPYSTYFLQYIGFAAQVPNVIFNWINIFLNARHVISY